MAEGLGDVALAYPDRAVEDHGLGGVQPPQGGQVADLGGGQLRGGGVVEAFQCDLFLEPGPAQATGDGHGAAAGDLVFAQDLEEVDVAEVPGAGLGEAGVDGGEHPRELQRAQCLVQGAGLDRGGHDGVLCFSVMAGLVSGPGGFWCQVRVDGWLPKRCWAAWRVMPSRAAIWVQVCPWVLARVMAAARWRRAWPAAA